MTNFQRGGFGIGLVVGLLLGLCLALGVALYITKAPIPFVNKVPQRTAEQDQAEQARNRNWDPNAPLAGKSAPRPPTAAAAASAPAAAASDTKVAAAKASAAPTTAVPGAAAAASAAKPGRDPAAILSGAVTPGSPAAPVPVTAAAANKGNDPFVYFVQAGAYTRADEAEQQRAKLAMMGQAAKITEREQAGRVVYRVRMGPYEGRGDADTLHGRLQESGIDSQIVRVERP